MAKVVRIYSSITGCLLIEYYYINKKQQGECKTYYNSGEINTVGYLINSKLNGQYKEFINSKIKSLTIYNNEKRVGLSYKYQYELVSNNLIRTIITNTATGKETIIFNR